MKSPRSDDKKVFLGHPQKLVFSFPSFSIKSTHRGKRCKQCEKFGKSECPYYSKGVQKNDRACPDFVARGKSDAEIFYSPGMLLPNGLIYEQVKGKRYVGKDSRGISYVSYFEFDDKEFWPMEKCPWKLVEAPLEYESEEQLWLEIREFLEEHLDLFDEREYDVLTGTILISWRFEDVNFIAYLYFIGPPGSGKTRALELLNTLGFRSILAVTMSAASLFRSVEAWKPFLALDEVQHYLHEKKEEFLALICGGQRRGQYAIRVKEVGEGKLELLVDDVFCLKAMASTRETTDTIKSRSIIIRMSKAVRPIPLFIDEETADELRAKLLTYRLRNVGKTQDEPDFKGFRDGRIVELFYYIAKMAPTPEIRDNIISYAKEFELDRLEAEKVSLYARVYDAFMKAVEVTGKAGKVSVRNVANAFNEDLEEKEKVNTRTMGRWLNAMGINKEARTSEGRMARKFDKRFIERLEKRYHPEDTEVSEVLMKGVSKQSKKLDKKRTPIIGSSETSETSASRKAVLIDIITKLRKTSTFKSFVDFENKAKSYGLSHVEAYNVLTQLIEQGTMIQTPEGVWKWAK